MRLVLTPEEKAIYLDLLEDLLNADTEYEIKSIEFQVISFLNNIKESRKNVEDFDEKAAAAQFVRAGKLKS
ncbi:MULTISPECIES: hypothetical protein [Bacillaceae]|jgi:hypothetical protein|uniref:Uncharacterized protein n=2 Tax=Gottfriedia TaxID=2837503 RepID=A0ABY4JPA1_9BACI|nr:MULTISPECIES: hypothetical protein [Bacillaceae]KQL38116.1 hypothetical protein AN960_14250 [Bacillus sp. FJAT-25509]ODG90262.1 hypothetical protein BED47_13110 [Gottfriedia luciferensis]PEC47369.1 hypothetical protein CON00_21960 [Bacillus sp. AFS096315]PET61291.1 hypothetical protein CN514_13990 [Bacillus sp. AFS001701]PFH86333.1 hypothetical protein COI44_13090 [Bacillus sp. AFS088145]